MSTIEELASGSLLLEDYRGFTSLNALAPSAMRGIDYDAKDRTNPTSGYVGEWLHMDPMFPHEVTVWYRVNGNDSLVGTVKL